MGTTFIYDPQGDRVDVNSDGSLSVKVIDRPIVNAAWEGSTSEEKPFEKEQHIFSITNDSETTDLFFTIGTITIKVKPGEPFEDHFAPFTSVSINASGPYRALVKGWNN